MDRNIKNFITFYVEDGRVFTDYSYDNSELFVTLLSSLFSGDLTVGTINYLIQQFELTNQDDDGIIMLKALLNQLELTNSENEPIVKPSQFR